MTAFCTSSSCSKCVQSMPWVNRNDFLAAMSMSRSRASSRHIDRLRGGQNVRTSDVILTSFHRGTLDQVYRSSEDAAEFLFRLHEVKERAPRVGGEADQDV